MPKQILVRADQAFAAGQLDEAVGLFALLAESGPWAAEANNKLGVIAGFQNRLPESRTFLEKALTAAPERIDIRQNLLLTLEHLGEQELALELLLDIGAMQYIGRDYLGATESFSRGLKFRPGWPRAWVNLAAALEARGDYAGALNLAIGHLRFAVTEHPEQAALMQELIDTFAIELRLEEAPASVEFDPDDTHRASAFNTLGSIARHRGVTDLACRAYKLAIQLAPDVAVFHQNLGQVQLATGEYQAGWQNYEARIGIFESVPDRKLDAQLWQGQALEGKTLLLWAEQGFGDSVQMLRFVPQLAGRAQRVILELQSELIRLAANLLMQESGLLNIEIVPRHPRKDTVFGDRCFDFHCPLLSLPQRLQLDAAAIHGQPYLQVPPADARRWQSWLKETPPKRGLRVGLVWAGRPTHSRDRVRSTTLQQMLPLLRLPGIRWVSLQVGPARAQINELPEGIDLLDLTPHLADFSDTAALIAGLDAVVSVDTAVVHVAGALGVPVAVILPAVPDWRWQFDRSDSPWYDSLTLFRRSDDTPLSTELLAHIGQWLTDLPSLRKHGQQGQPPAPTTAAISSISAPPIVRTAP